MKNFSEILLRLKIIGAIHFVRSDVLKIGGTGVVWLASVNVNVNGME